MASASSPLSLMGNHYVISDLCIYRPVTTYVGFFGIVGAGAVIRNVGAENVYVHGDEYVGGLAGRNHGGTIVASHVMGSVKGGGNNVGGLAGENAGIIMGDYATAEVVGGSNTGGLVGSNLYGTIAAAYATGDVTGDGLVGGLVGANAISVIRASYARGDVTGNGDYVGGLVGNNYQATITASYYDRNASVMRNSVLVDLTTDYARSSC